MNKSTTAQIRERFDNDVERFRTIKILHKNMCLGAFGGVRYNIVLKDYKMNKALYVKNWISGGNNYVLRGNPKNRWVGFQEKVLKKLIENYGYDFNIVIWTNDYEEHDHYCIPYKILNHLFTAEHKTTGKYPDRWTAIILEHKFLMHSNSLLSVDISDYYGMDIFHNPHIHVQEDYFIENAKAEINIRIGQSKFRNGVLKNFESKCALSNVSELCLLRASHIIPWGTSKDYRADFSNGICLYVEYDVLFDKGYFTFTDDLEVIILIERSDISSHLKNTLNQIEHKRLRQPLKSINPFYLKYHRENIFIDRHLLTSP